MSNHTPGPWHQGNKPGQNLYIFDNQGRAIVQSVEVKNVPLIASAPNLLNLCERAFRALNWDDFPQLKEDLKNEIEKATP
jgi:hypothetical protein